MAEHHAYLGVMLRLQAATAEFDVLHNNSVHHLPIAMARAIPVPMVTTLHTPPTPWLESALSLCPPPAANAFVAVSRHTADAWAHLVPGIRVIPNGIDMDAWTPGAGGPDLVWCGRIVPEKAPHLAIDAARAAGMRLRLAGPVHDPAYWLREVAPRLGPDARWVGHLAGSALRSLVGASAAMLITPAWDEPFGLVALEALACGTPVAAFDRGGLGEIPDADSGVLVPGGDVPALARAARAAVRLDRRACRRRARRVGCAGRMAGDYRRVYAEVAA
jgi:glycosyltransferase involved in cell wall biosynthesis